jgi:hypothetical protein
MHFTLLFFVFSDCLSVFLSLCLSVCPSFTISMCISSGVLRNA